MLCVRCRRQCLRRYTTEFAALLDSWLMTQDTSRSRFYFWWMDRSVNNISHESSNRVTSCVRTHGDEDACAPLICTILSKICFGRKVICMLPFLTSVAPLNQKHAREACILISSPTHRPPLPPFYSPRNSVNVCALPSTRHPDPNDPFVKHYTELSNGRIEFHRVDL